MENLDKIASGIVITIGIAMPFMLLYSHKAKNSAKEMYEMGHDLLKTYKKN